MFIADLHIHSHFSRATSRVLIPELLDWWARRKGIQVVGPGDFTHPGWRQELAEKLIPAEEGLYRLREDCRRLDGLPAGGEIPVRFMVTGEISSIYKWDGRVRKVHSLILLPGLEEAEALALLDRLGLPDTGAQPVREFSGGMKRRLALARALLAPFDALALDEPFTGLDRENRDLALACIRETAGDRPVLLVTHDAADAAGSPVVTL